MAATAAATYQPVAIERALASIERWEAGRDDRLATRSEDVLEMWSEDLVAQTATAVDAALRLLGADVSATHDSCPPHRSSPRNADAELHERWIHDVMNDRPDLADRRWADAN